MPDWMILVGVFQLDKSCDCYRKPLSDLETVTAVGSRARQRQCRNATPSSRGIASPEINPVGKPSPGAGHNLLLLLLCRKAFGEVLKNPKDSQTLQESCLLFTSSLWYLREVSKRDTELVLGAGCGLWVPFEPSWLK